MKSSTRFLIFFAALLIALGFVEWFARHTVRTTLAWETLHRYDADRPSYAVFLGSSLTDAGVRVDQLDSALREVNQGVPSHNLALAGMSGSEYYYLILKNHLMGKNRPKFLVVEASGLPFFPLPPPFKLEGEGERVELIQAELMSYRDFVRLSGGFPGVMASLSFWLHKHWFSYHYRLEIQAKIRERLFRFISASRPTGYFQGRDFRPVFSETAQRNLRRLGHTAFSQTLQLPRNHFLDLVTMTKQAGIGLIVLNPPCPPIDQVMESSPAYREYNHAFADLCDSLHVGYFDFTGVGTCGPYTFSDGIHLDEAGSAKFTRCLVERMRDRMKSMPISSR